MRNAHRALIAVALITVMCLSACNTVSSFAPKKTEETNVQSFQEPTVETATPAPTAVPTPTPTATPIPPIMIIENPTEVSAKQGDTVSFTAKAENAIDSAWVMFTPEDEELSMSDVSERFWDLSYQIQDTTLILNNIPAEMNGWKVACRFWGFDEIQTVITPTAALQVQTWLDLYEPVFVNYRAVANVDINTFDHSKDTYGVLGSYDLTLWQDVTYGYLLRDIDGNGVPELIVGNMASPDDNLIHAMFTIIDEQPQMVFCSWTRNRYFLSETGGIYHSGSNGAMNGDNYICSYSGTSVTPIYGCYTSDGDNYGFNIVKDGDRYTGSSEQVTQEEYFQYLTSLEQTIIPLSDLSLIWIF